MLRLIRRYQWHNNCVPLAKQAVRAKKTQKDKNGEYRVTITREYTLEDATEKEYLARYAKMDYSWYPDSWFAFLIMGKPAIEGRVSYMFNGGIAQVQMSAGLAPDMRVMQLGARAGRRRFHEQTNKADFSHPAELPSKRKRGTPTSSGTPSSAAEGDTAELNKCKFVCGTMQLEIALMESLNMDEVEVTLKKRKLLKYMEISRKMVERSIEIYDLTGLSDDEEVEE
jgi:hypothetical protein